MSSTVTIQIATSKDFSTDTIVRDVVKPFDYTQNIETLIEIEAVDLQDKYPLLYGRARYNVPDGYGTSRWSNTRTFNIANNIGFFHEDTGSNNAAADFTTPYGSLGRFKLIDGSGNIIPKMDRAFVKSHWLFKDNFEVFRSPLEMVDDSQIPIDNRPKEIFIKFKKFYMAIYPKGIPGTDSANKYTFMLYPAKVGSEVETVLAFDDIYSNKKDNDFVMISRYHLKGFTKNTNHRPFVAAEGNSYLNGTAYVNSQNFDAFHISNFNEQFGFIRYNNTSTNEKGNLWFGYGQLALIRIYWTLIMAGCDNLEDPETRYLELFGSMISEDFFGIRFNWKYGTSINEMYFTKMSTTVKGLNYVSAQFDASTKPELNGLVGPIVQHHDNLISFGGVAAQTFATAPISLYRSTATMVGRLVPFRFLDKNAARVLTPSLFNAELQYHRKPFNARSISHVFSTETCQVSSIKSWPFYNLSTPHDGYNYSVAPELNHYGTKSERFNVYNQFNGNPAVDNRVTVTHAVKFHHPNKSEKMFKWTPFKLTKEPVSWYDTSIVRSVKRQNMNSEYDSQVNYNNNTVESIDDIMRPKEAGRAVLTCPDSVKHQAIIGKYSFTRTDGLVFPLGLHFTKRADVRLKMPPIDNVLTVAAVIDYNGIRPGGLDCLCGVRSRDGLYHSFGVRIHGRDDQISSSNSFIGSLDGSDFINGSGNAKEREWINGNKNSTFNEYLPFSLIQIKGDFISNYDGSFDTIGSTLWRNDVPSETTPITNYTPTGDRAFIGILYEIMFFDYRLTEDEINKLSCYFALKWDYLLRPGKPNHNGALMNQLNSNNPYRNTMLVY